MRAKEIKGYDRQVKLSFEICESCLKLCSVACPDHPKKKVRHLVNYYFDFVVHLNNGTDEYVEVKGVETGVNCGGRQSPFWNRLLLSR
jgi:hypothetical protein